MRDSTVCNLLCLVNLSTLSKEQEAQAKALAKQLGNDWNEFFTVAMQNSAYLLTKKRLLTLQLLPANLDAQSLASCQNFLEKSEIIEAAGAARILQFEKVLEQAHAQTIPVILLKGGLLGTSLYQNPNYKKMNDLDVLVPFAQAEKFSRLLESLHFTSVGKLFDQKEFSAKSHHAPPYVSSDLKCMIGIHWNLCSPYAVWKPNIEGIWSRSSAVSAFGSEAIRMSWEENLLHLCIHLPFFKIGVRELADVYNLVLFSDPRVDWNLFAQLTREWKAEDAAWRVLSLASALIPLSIPPQILEEWKKRAHAFTIADTERRLALGFNLISTRSVQIGKIEKAFTIFRLTENFQEKLLAWAMTWILTFWPKQKELARILGRDSLPSHFALLRARLVVGTYCWRAMARDYGNFALSVITLLNFLQVLKKLFLWPFSPCAPSIRQNPQYRILEALE